MRAIAAGGSCVGRSCQVARLAVDQPQRVLLANKIDSAFITPDDIHKTVRLIRGEGV
jgi:2-oxoglutarate ferredoxin oxidoreductase subunit alpha